MVIIATIIFYWHDDEDCELTIWAVVYRMIKQIFKAKREWLEPHAYGYVRGYKPACRSMHTCDDRWWR